MGTEDLAKAVEKALLLPQQLRQLRDVRRDLARLVFGGQLGGRSPAGFVLMVDESKLLAAAIDHDKAGFQFLNSPRRREVAGSQVRAASI
jgi:hypothetical protein